METEEAKGVGKRVFNGRVGGCEGKLANIVLLNTIM